MTLPPLTDVIRTSPRPTPESGRMDASRLLGRLLESGVVLPEEWDELAANQKTDACEAEGEADLVRRLAGYRLLTPYQATRIKEGGADELLVGSYRVLEPIGKGGMGVVYKAEHTQLRRVVALKMTGHVIGNNPRLLNRFYAEARAVARLNHPNIVACMDAGRIPAVGNRPARDYFVLEYVPGMDLENLVRDRGPLPVTRAAELFRQVAEALVEAHGQNLVHRDLKPSNIVVTPDWRVKVLDFGLALHPRRQSAGKNLTEPGTLLGSIGYMAPEQARDPRGVDGRADLFSLGASLYWAITGKEPFPDTGRPILDLNRRMTLPPPDVRLVRPEFPAGVADLIVQLLQVDPSRRLPTAAAAAVALAPLAAAASHADWSPDLTPVPADKRRILIVDPDEDTVGVATELSSDFAVCVARSVDDIPRAFGGGAVDLVVLNVTVLGGRPEGIMAGLRRGPAETQPLILAVSGSLPLTLLSGMTGIGADDFLAKPFRPGEVASRVRTMFDRRAARSKSRIETNPNPNPEARPAAAPGEAWDLMTATVARLLADNWYLASGFRTRVGQGVHILSQAVAGTGEYARLKDPAYVAMLTASAGLYDIGLLVLPGGLPVKPGALDDYEKEVIRTHPAVGAEILKGLTESFPHHTGLITLAAEIALGHHERWNGTGYPDGVAGPDIPLAARVIGLASVYDSVRSRRPYRTPMNHARAVRLIAEESPGRFDPALLQAFLQSTARFEQTFVDCPTK